MTEVKPATATAVSTTWTPGHPVDLRRTLWPLRRGGLDPTMRVDDDGLWRTCLTPDGPATLLLTVPIRGSVDARAWGRGADWAIDQLPELLGSGDDWTDLDCSAHPLLDRTRRAVPGLRTPAPHWFSSRWYRRSWNNGWWGRTPDAPGSNSSPSSATPPKGRRRTAYGCARRPGSGAGYLPGNGIWPASTLVGPQRSLPQPGLPTDSNERCMPDAAAPPSPRPCAGAGYRGLDRRRDGATAHGDPDTVSVGDYHLAALVGWALIGEPVDDDGMLELLSQWPGHRHHVVRLIESSGFRKPRFGPRSPRLNHRGH